MKKLISMALVVWVFAVQGQEHKKAVTTQFLDYYALLQQKNFEKAADYMNPEIFKIVPKDQLIAAMASVYNTPGMDLETDSATMKEVGPMVQKNNMNYVVLRYGSAIRIRFAEADSSVLRSTFESQFGKENVSYNSATGFYSIYANKKAVGNSADGKKWTFIVVEPRQIEMLKTFIPEELLQ